MSKFIQNPPQPLAHGLLREGVDNQCNGCGLISVAGEADRQVQCFGLLTLRSGISLPMLLVLTFIVSQIAVNITASIFVKVCAAI